jgi:hypothetical protein
VAMVLSFLGGERLPIVCTVFTRRARYRFERQRETRIDRAALRPRLHP